MTYVVKRLTGKPYKLQAEHFCENTHAYQEVCKRKRQIDIYSVTRDIAIYLKSNFWRRRTNSIALTVHLVKI
jgi:hypothetical protein